MVVRMRHTRSQTRQTRSHHALRGVSLAVCSNCGAKKMKHTVCSSCGKYKGREILDVVGKAGRKAAKKEAKRKEETGVAKK